MHFINMFIQWVYPMGLSNGFIQWVYPMVLINRFIQWVLSIGLSNAFIKWFLSIGLSNGSCRESYLIGLLIRIKLYNLCCPASLCPRHPNPSHTVNPDLYTGLLIRTLVKGLDNCCHNGSR